LLKDFTQEKSDTLSLLQVGGPNVWENMMIGITKNMLQGHRKRARYGWSAALN
jgi:hypothetical protein